MSLAGCSQVGPLFGMQDEVDAAAEALQAALSGGGTLESSAGLDDLARSLGLGEMDDRIRTGGPAILAGADEQGIEIIAGVAVRERTWFGENTRHYYVCVRLHADGSGDRVVYEQADCPEDAGFLGPVVTAAEADLEMSWPR